VIVAAREDLFFEPLPRIRRLLREREVSPVELAELALARLESIGRELNAVATLTRTRALAEARAAERELRDGRDRGPLHGVPWAAKDLFDTAGIVTTYGAAPFAERIPETDATVVARLREAGAVLCAKLTMAELAGGLGYHRGNASLHGPMRNPWDPERWTGGSSAGSGAAVAAGLVPFALGSETWGSILCPSAFCGVTGLRPTYGRVSRAGAMALSWTLDKVGPLARGAEDARLVLDAIAGPDPADPSTSGRALDWSGASRSPRGLRVAVLRANFAEHGEPEVGRAFDRALGDLEAAGLRLEDAKLPDLPFEAAAVVAVQVEAVASFAPLFEDGARGARRLVDERAFLQAEVAKAIPGHDYVKSLRLRRVMQEAMNRFFADHDAIVAPNFLKVAPGVLEDMDPYFRGGDPVGGMGNACGLPALALPMGFGRAGMPCGFQVVAPAFEEATLLRIGRAYQERTAWHRERPKLA
jgi:aspartyl-tRNA(Asn)/glutamyl-tRNA(Gln) amidotransferase subunit A